MKEVIVALSFSLLFLMVSNAVPVNGVNSINIITPENKPYGLSYQEHVINFWKHILAIPADGNPWNDRTGESCAVGQLQTNSSVFYLSGNGGGKSDLICKMPAGKGLFIPVSPMEISDKEAPNKSIEELHTIAREDQDSVNSLYLKIGDTEYMFPDLKKYRISTPDFNVVYPQSAIFGADEGNAKAVADGFYVITTPLPTGNYSITYRSSLGCLGPDCVEPAFAQDVNYKLTVK